MVLNKDCDVPNCQEPWGSRPAKGFCTYHANKWWYYSARGFDRDTFLIYITREECDCCGRAYDPKKLVTDHDHSHCGPKVWCSKCARGRVCPSCNLKLTALDAPGWLAKGKRYLEFYGKTTELN